MCNLLLLVVSQGYNTFKTAGINIFSPEKINFLRIFHETPKIPRENRRKKIPAFPLTFSRDALILTQNSETEERGTGIWPAGNTDGAADSVWK